MKFPIPMAVSLGFGVIAATAIWLTLAPSGYVIAGGLNTRLQRLWGGSEELTGP